MHLAKYMLAKVAGCSAARSFFIDLYGARFKKIAQFCIDNNATLTEFPIVIESKSTLTSSTWSSLSIKTNASYFCMHFDKQITRKLGIQENIRLFDCYFSEVEMDKFAGQAGLLAQLTVSNANKIVLDKDMLDITNTATAAHTECKIIFWEKK